MSKKDFACLVGFIVGVILFLYGSNYYSPVSGWLGLFLIVASIVMEIVFEIYGALGKRSKSPQKA